MVAFNLPEESTSRISIRGVDGSLWKIHGADAYNSPVQIEKGSLGDIFDAPVATSRKARVGQPGMVYRGHRYMERHIALNVTMQADHPDDRFRIDSDFRQAFSYEEPAELIVDTDLSGERSLQVRLSEHPTIRGDYDPVMGRVSQITFPLVADDPFFSSTTVTDEFTFTGMNWYGGGVYVSNPGDVPIWPKWVLTAPAKFILPDVSFRDDAEKARQVVLPFQPLKRTVLVDTDPGEEMIVANDDALLWAQMGGQFFNNPIPPHTPRTFVPVSVDPLPNLPWVIPDSMRRWIAQQIAAWAKTLGAEQMLTTTPDQLAAKIKQFINDVTPDWVEDLNPDLLKELVPSLIAGAIRDQWGSIGNMAGATAQVRLERRWSRPWGME